MREEGETARKGGGGVRLGDISHQRSGRSPSRSRFDQLGPLVEIGAGSGLRGAFLGKSFILNLRGWSSVGVSLCLSPRTAVGKDLVDSGRSGKGGSRTSLGEGSLSTEKEDYPYGPRISLDPDEELILEIKEIAQVKPLLRRHCHPTARAH